MKTIDIISVLDTGGVTYPPFNLALEEYLVRLEDAETVLFVYRNEPSIVLGKHQNVLEEADFRRAEAEGVQIVRRISGGGTVYHDLGNLNIALLAPHDPLHHNNYAPLLEPLVRLLEHHGVRARINERNSLVLDDGRKISGSAQFVSRGRMLTHATLLYDADLDLLDRLLTPATPIADSRAVPSVRSRVANLAPMMPEVSGISELAGMIEEAFAGADPVRRVLNDEERSSVQELVTCRYETWEWRIGRSPRFSLGLQSATGESHVVTFRDGIIVAVDGETADIGEGGRGLLGMRLDEILEGDRWVVVDAEGQRTTDEAS